MGLSLLVRFQELDYQKVRLKILTSASVGLALSGFDRS
jgi:hypothetical protein